MCNEQTLRVIDVIVLMLVLLLNFFDSVLASHRKLFHEYGERPFWHHLLEEQIRKLQWMVEKMHVNWTVDRTLENVEYTYAGRTMNFGYYKMVVQHIQHYLNVFAL